MNRYAKTQITEIRALAEAILDEGEPTIVEEQIVHEIKLKAEQLEPEAER